MQNDNDLSDILKNKDINKKKKVKFTYQKIKFGDYFSIILKF